MSVDQLILPITGFISQMTEILTKRDKSVLRSMLTNNQDWDACTLKNIQAQMRPFKRRRLLRYTEISMG